MATERQRECADDHDEQLQHPVIVAGVGGKFDSDEFWRWSPVSRRMTAVSMCHISTARVVRTPIFGLAGCTRRRGRRQPNQVEGEAQTVLSSWARTARGRKESIRAAWP
jgi:hypothetical protein